MRHWVRKVPSYRPAKSYRVRKGVISVLFLARRGLLLGRSVSAVGGSVKEGRSSLSYPRMMIPGSDDFVSDYNWYGDIQVVDITRNSTQHSVEISIRLIRYSNI